MKKIAIIGGGIAGLTAAYRAEQLRRQELADYVLFEQAPRLGGVIATETVDGCVVEGGPDSFLTEKPAAAELCRELGLGNDLIGSNDAERSTAILLHGRLVPLPDGLQFMVPTRILPTLTTRLFSIGAKLRFAREYLSPPARAEEGEDESVAEFVRRHFGDEVVERLADPLLSGIYGGSAERLSARAVLPRMLEMERRHGSLIRGMLAARQVNRSNAPHSGGAPRPLFTSLRGGMSQLVSALAAQLDPARVRTGCTVRGLKQEGESWYCFAQDAAAEQFDAVVLALPAYAAATLLKDVHSELARLLGDVHYTSSITVVLGYDAEATRGAALRGFGFLVPSDVPRSEPHNMLACTFVHHKFPHRAPDGRALLRCFIGGERGEALMGADDGELVGLMLPELKAAIGLGAEPLFTRVFRWPRAMAQYEVGHQERMLTMERLRGSLPGLALAGNAYRGIGVPDCIATGTAAIAQLTGTTAQPAAGVRIGGMNFG